jgi:ribosomal protein S18 acetylase RimI-like enzyme
MQIREATTDDEPTLTDELLHPGYRSSEEYAPDFNELDDEAVADADGSRWLDQDDRILFVAEDDGELTGHVSGILTDAPPIFDRGRQLHVDGLYVKPAFRREGVADRLLERIEDWAQTRDCEYVGVTVHVENDAAKRLYDDRYERTFYSYRRKLD